MKLFALGAIDKNVVHSLDKSFRIRAMAKIHEVPLD